MFFTDTAQLFLESIGRHQEVEHYLRRFRGDGESVFALIVPDADTCREARELLFFHLRFLARLDLRPAVLLSGTASDFCKDFEKALGAEARIPLRCEDRPLVFALNRYIARGGRRVHFLRSRGRMEGEGGPLALCAPDQKVVRQDEALLRICHDLLAVEPDLHLSVCSPADLLREIFTIKGAGTLFRRPSSIRHTPRVSVEDKQRLEILIEKSFGKRLKDPAFLDRVSDFFIEERFQGAVLLETTPWGMYLSKFAVGVDARGSGIAQDLWQVVVERYPRIFWRSRQSNTIHRWYERIADGFFRHEKGWNIYWKGISVEALPEIIPWVAGREPDFVETDVGVEVDLL